MIGSTATRTPFGGWMTRRAAFALAIFVALLVIQSWLYRETVFGMVSIWERSETFNHCFLIPPIVVWLVWRRRSALALVPSSPYWWALIPLAGCGMAWLAGFLARVDVVTHFALVGMTVFLVPLVFGIAVTRQIVFPLAYLFLCVPFGEFAMPWMMEWTADFTVGALVLSGIPVHREGLHFVIPSGRWSVVEACSGIRYLIASVTVGTLFANLSYRHWWKRIAFGAASILVPIVANWVRAYLIVMIGHLSSNRLAAGVDHIIYGWVFFGIVIMILFAIGSRYADTDSDAPPAPHTDSSPPSDWNSTVAAVGICATLVLVYPPLTGARLALGGLPASAPRIELPSNLPDWSHGVPSRGAWKPAFETPTAEARARYAGQYGEVDVYIAFYRRQREGGKMVGSESVLVSSMDPEWTQTARGSTEIRWNGQPQTIRTGRLSGVRSLGQQAGDRMLVWYVYWVDGKLLAREVDVKVWTAWSMLSGRGDGGLIMVVSTKDDPGSAARLQGFLDAASPALTNMAQLVAGGGT